MNDEENGRIDRIESYLHAKINFAHLAATREKLERFIYGELRWWSGIKLSFVLDHLSGPWMIPFEERACPDPQYCDRHYDHVQGFLWRTGKVIRLFPFLRDEQKEQGFPAMGDSFDEFVAALRGSAPTRAERRLPDDLIPRWWECFGNNCAPRT